jgi:hypothetical protein
MRASLVLVLVAATSGVVQASAVAEERVKAKETAPAAFTLGIVQKELRSGLSQADVAERLGAPNILTRDAEGREAWVYDKVSSEFEASSGGVGVGGLGAGAGSTLTGLLGISAGKRSDKAKTSQRTLTVVLRFSAAGTLESFRWHNSQF